MRCSCHEQLLDTHFVFPYFLHSISSCSFYSLLHLIILLFLPYLTVIVLLANFELNLIWKNSYYLSLYRYSLIKPECHTLHIFEFELTKMKVFFNFFSLISTRSHQNIVLHFKFPCTFILFISHICSLINFSILASGKAFYFIFLAPFSLLPFLISNPIAIQLLALTQNPHCSSMSSNSYFYNKYNYHFIEKKV